MEYKYWQKGVTYFCQTSNGRCSKCSKKTLKETDFIHAEMFLCGQSADKSTTILTVKNSFGKTIKAYKFNSSTIIFGGDIPVKDLLNTFTIGETISIYFTISGIDKDLNSTVLLGRLKLD